MSSPFNDIVEEVRRLPLEHMEELSILLNKYLIEARRNEIKRDYLRTKREVKEKKLEFSSDINTQKRMLE